MGEVLRQISMPPSDKHDPFDPAAFLQVVGCLTECVDENGKIVPVFNGDEVADASEFLTALFDLLIIEEIRKSKSGDQISTKVGELFGGTTTQIVRVAFIHDFGYLKRANIVRSWNVRIASEPRRVR